MIRHRQMKNEWLLYTACFSSLSGLFFSILLQNFSIACVITSLSALILIAFIILEEIKERNN